MDAGYKDSDGYVYVMARSDDVINVAGHRLSTGAIEEVRLWKTGDDCPWDHHKCMILHHKDISFILSI